MSLVATAVTDSIEQQLSAQFSLQKKAFDQEPYPSLEERRNRLDRLHNSILSNKDDLIRAVNEDFGTRSDAETLMAEIFPLLEGISYCRKRLKRWMRPQRRHTPMLLSPASVSLHAQPLGVIGVVVPWNFPIFLGLSPLIYAVAAGNRIMIKMSEFAPATGVLIARMMESIFDPTEVAVINGDVSTATAFTSLPFDHLVFTGSTGVGRIVLQAAANNLTPVTLELGGKSPALIHTEFPVKEAAKRISFGKSINAGQVCVSPDYVLCHEDRANEFAMEFINEVKRSYPSLKDNPDYTSIINSRQRERLEAYVSDAEQKGAKVLRVNPLEESLAGSSKLSMTVLLDVDDSMRVMQEEIFGPLLPIVTYRTLDEALRYVSNKPRPLALYYFDWNKSRATDVLQKTHSGGVCINDTMSHVMADDIPFGGVGPSGMGHYHGREGFETFSNLKGVVSKGRLNSTALVGPPWDTFLFRSLAAIQWARFRKKVL